MDTKGTKIISKEQALEILQKEGYQAVLEKNILYLLYRTDEEYRKLSSGIKEHLRDLGYQESFGIKPSAEKASQANFVMEPDVSGADY